MLIQKLSQLFQKPEALAIFDITKSFIPMHMSICDNDFLSRLNMLQQTNYSYIISRATIRIAASTPARTAARTIAIRITARLLL